MPAQTFDRRRFVRLLATGIAIAGATLLDACAPAAPNVPAPAAPTGAPTRGLQLPNRVALQGIKPDLPASGDGLIDAAFVNYPPNPPRTVPDTPGRGGEVTVMTWTIANEVLACSASGTWRAGLNFVPGRMMVACARLFGGSGQRTNTVIAPRFAPTLFVCSSTYRMTIRRLAASFVDCEMSASKGSGDAHCLTA